MVDQAFQSTLRRTERLVSTIPNSSDFIISIHAPTNGATHRILRRRMHWKFQSTLRRTERPRYLQQQICRCHFNPRSDERSDPLLSSSKNSIHSISIHAPTNGATIYSLMMRLKELISIHAPTNGATNTSLTNRGKHTNFNPRSDERSDLE